MSGVPSHLTPLRLSQPAKVDVAAVADLLNGRAEAWLGVPVPGPRPETHRFLTDLSLPIREHAPSLTFKKAAYVDLGKLETTPERCDIEIGWQSSSLAPLFPVFAGRLSVTADRIVLDGYYAPPGGEVGAALDKAFLNIAARGTARWFLGKVAQALSAPVPSPASSPASSPAASAEPSPPPLAAPLAPAPAAADGSSSARRRSF